MKQPAPPWIHESPQTASYIADASMPAHSPAERHIYRTAAEAFSVATDSFIDTLGYRPLDVADNDFTSISGWKQLADELICRYIEVSNDLADNNETYRDTIGTVYDGWRRLYQDIPTPFRFPDERKAEYASEAKQLVTHAVNEGIHTSIAVFQVVPALAKAASRRHRMPYSASSKQLLESAQVFSIKLSRHSKHGNDYLLLNHSAFGTQNENGIDYDRLVFDPATFRVVAGRAGRLIIESAVNNRLQSDFDSSFVGCPAFIGGSVGELNRAIATIIRQEDILRRAVT